MPNYVYLWRRQGKAGRGGCGRGTRKVHIKAAQGQTARTELGTRLQM